MTTNSNTNKQTNKCILFFKSEAVPYINQLKQNIVGKTTCHRIEGRQLNKTKKHNTEN